MSCETLQERRIFLANHKEIICVKSPRKIAIVVKSVIIMMCCSPSTVTRRSVTCVYLIGSTGSFVLIQNNPSLQDNKSLSVTPLPRPLPGVFSSNPSVESFIARFLNRVITQIMTISREARQRQCLLVLEKSREKRIHRLQQHVEAPSEMPKGFSVAKSNSQIIVWPRSHLSLARVKEHHQRKACVPVSESKSKGNGSSAKRLSLLACGVSRRECDVTCSVGVCSQHGVGGGIPRPSHKCGREPEPSVQNQDPNYCPGGVNFRQESIVRMARGDRSPLSPLLQIPRQQKSPSRSYLCSPSWAPVGPSGVWAWLLITLTLWACLVTAHQDTGLRNGCEAYAGSKGEVCGSRYIRNNPKGLSDLCKCRKIRGCLHISLMKVDNNTTALLNSFSFHLLKEVTDYIFLYRVPGIRTLRHMFPNLTIIRGESLFYNYALVIYSLPSLEEVGLLSLTTILRGSVRIEKNPSLCYVHTLDWDRITVYPLGENVLKRNRLEECASCPATLDCRGWNTCDGARCWGPRDCQQVCDQKCTAGCVGDECCHEECVGGCSVPHNASSCTSCRHVLHGDRCLDTCPTHLYKMFDNSCVTKSECIRRNGFVAEEKRGCERCPPNRREYRGRCLPLRGFSRYRVDAVISSISHAQNLRRYKFVHSLVISITGGENVERELQSCLSNIEEVEDYVKIFRTNITSTKILPNLRKIHGKNLVYTNYSLVVLDNPNLRTLSPWTDPDRQLSIAKGKVFFQTNPKLCLDQIYTLVASANLSSSVSETDVSTFSNGQEASCESYELPAQLRNSPFYGTLIVRVGPLPASVSTYYISYKKADQNVTLHEETCSNQGSWSVEEFIRRSSEGGVFDLQLSGLESATRYAVYVKAYSLKPGGTVVQSSIKYAFTSPFNPSEPVGIGWASTSSSELELWWSEPLQPNGVIDHYLVTLVMVPRINVERDFCSPMVDDRLKQIARQLEEKRETYLLMQKTRWEKDNAPSEKPEPDTCLAPPRCCSCDGEETKEVEVPTDVSSTEDFERLLMDDEMYKEVIYARGQRSTPERATTPERLQTTNPKDSDALAHSFSRILETSLIGVDEPALLPVDLIRTADRSANSDGNDQESRSDLHALLAYYREHKQNSSYFVQDPDNSYFQVVHQLTYDSQLSVRNLRHHALYAVGVVACHAPTNCTFAENGTGGGDPAGRKYQLCKLCSSVPAQVAATTALNNTSDIIPEGSLQAIVDNKTASVSLSWKTPEASNSDVLSYLYYCTLHQSPKSTHCVTQRQFKEAGHKVYLRDLVPGKYSCWVKVRSEVGDGPESSRITFIVPDPATAEDMRAVWWLVGVSLIVISFLIGWSWRRHRIRHTLPDTVDEVDNNPFYREGFAPSELFRENYILFRDDLKVLFELPLGHGYFGMVFTGELRQGDALEKVAVKTHNESASTEEIKQFLKEAALMQDIKCHHVVEFVGVVGDYAPVYVVMELMEEGDLKSLLKKQRSSAVTDQKVLEMAVQASDGMSYLASRRLVHRDLAARNCMLDRNLTLKIGDFGLTRNLKSDYYRREGQGLLPVKWMAPESLKFSRFSTQSDVWSYGVLLWEMATRGVTPYKNNTNDDVIRLVVENRATLPRPRNCPDPFYKVMRRCWKFNPCDRPTFPAITKYLLKYTREQFQDSFEQVSFFHNAEREANKNCSGSEVRASYMTEASQEEDALYDDLANGSDLSDEGTPEGDSSREQRRTEPRKSGTTPVRPRHTLHFPLKHLSHRHFSAPPQPSCLPGAATPLLALQECAASSPVEASIPSSSSKASSTGVLTQRDVHIYTNFITRELPQFPRCHPTALAALSHRRVIPETFSPSRRPGGGHLCLSCATLTPDDTTFQRLIASPSVEVPQGALSLPVAASAPSSPCCSSQVAETAALARSEFRRSPPCICSQSRVLGDGCDALRAERNDSSVLGVSAICQRELSPLTVSAPFLSVPTATWTKTGRAPPLTYNTSSHLKEGTRRRCASSQMTPADASSGKTQDSLTEPQAYARQNLPTLCSRHTAEPSSAALPSADTAPSDTPPLQLTTALAASSPTSSSTSTAPASADSLASSPKTMLAVFSATSDLGSRHSSRSPASVEGQRDFELM